MAPKVLTITFRKQNKQNLHESNIIETLLKFHNKSLFVFFIEILFRSIEIERKKKNQNLS
jgi:hypothetical protein